MEYVVDFTPQLRLYLANEDYPVSRITSMFVDKGRLRAWYTRPYDTTTYLLTLDDSVPAEIIAGQLQHLRDSGHPIAKELPHAE